MDAPGRAAADEREEPVDDGDEQRDQRPEREDEQVRQREQPAQRNGETPPLEIVAFLGFFVAVAAGRYPRGFRDLSAYTLRYQAQTFAYLLFLTDRYPSLAETAVVAMPANSSAAVDRT